MKSTFKLPLAIVVAAALPTLGIHCVHAQTRTAPAYIVNEIDVHDAAGFSDYAKREGVLIKRFGGRFLARGGKVEGIAGALPRRTTIYVFDSLEKAQAWRDAPEQAELAVARDKSSTFRSFVVQGCADCTPPAAR